MTYNFGSRQSGFRSSPAKESTLLEKLGHDVPIIIERCDVVLFQEVTAEWAPNIVASFPGTWNLHFAKEPTLFTCRNSDVRQADEISAMLHVPGSGAQQQRHEGLVHMEAGTCSSLLAAGPVGRHIRASASSP